MPRRARRELTDALVRSAKPREGIRTSYSDALVPGFELRVSTQGKRTFSFRYQSKSGRAVRVAIGEYRTGFSHGGISLADARDQAARLRAAVRAGGEPRKLLADAIAAPPETITFAALMDSYLAALAPRVRASTLALNRQRLNTHTLSVLGDRDAASIRRAEVRLLLQQIGAQHPATARAVAGLIGSVFRHARIELELELGNPAEGLQRLFARTTRDRVLSDEELRRLWLAFVSPETSPMSSAMAHCMQLGAVTLQRGGELIGIHDREIDLQQQLWVIPSARSKNRREHLVPLSGHAVRIIEAARRERDCSRRQAGLSLTPSPLFPSRANPDVAIDRHALTRAMTRLCSSLGIDDAGMHDLRRTGATNLTSERLGVPRFHVSAVLGHISETGGVTAVYDRNNYVVQKRQALEAWAELLERIVSRTKIVAPSA